jgi:hypothetical protein
MTVRSGTRDLRADRCRRTEAHRCVAAGGQHAARRVDWKLLADAVLVPADSRS